MTTNAVLTSLDDHSLLAAARRLASEERQATAALLRPLPRCAWGVDYRVLIKVSLVLSVAAWGLSAGSVDLAQRRIPARPELTLEFPVDATRLVGALQQALMDAGVESGIERAPQGSEPERSSTRAATPNLRFNSRTVRDVLTEFTALDPRYEWWQSDGRILVRPRSTRGAESFLQTRLPDLELRRASMADAMARFSELALTPTHWYFTGQFRRGESAMSQRTVTVKLPNPTVLEALNAMSRSAGSLSWTVSYVSSVANATGARVSIVEPDQTYGLTPPSVR
ncbi:hypothetical protein BH18ACI5_BH18ACI5_02770 [soil metagenome]